MESEGRLMYDSERKSNKQNKPATAENSAFASRRGGRASGKPLSVSGNLARQIKSSFGIDAGELSLRESPHVSDMGAKATAQGSVISFAPGQFRPDTREGMKMLGHELSHVREQAKGGVRANLPGTNIHYDEGHESAGNRAGDAFARDAMNSDSPVSLGGMDSAAMPVQGFFGRKDTRPMSQRKPEEIRAHLKKRLQSRQKRKQSGILQAKKMFPKITSGSGAGKFDARIAGVFGTDLDKKSREKYFQDYGSFDPEKRKGHINRIYSGLTDQLRGMTPEMANEDYIIDNFDEMNKLVDEQTGYNNIHNENLDYQYPEGQEETLKGDKTMTYMNNIFMQMLSKYGLDQKGGDSHQEELEKKMALENANRVIPIYQEMYKNALSERGELPPPTAQQPTAQQSDDAGGGGGNLRSKMWSGIKSAGSTAGNALSSAGSIGVQGAQAGLGAIGSSIKKGASGLGNKIGDKWTRLRHIFD